MSNQKENKMAIHIDDVDFSHVVNRNEKKVRLAIAEFLGDFGNNSITSQLSVKDVQDIYALTLNQLPARYAQKATIIINDPVRPVHIDTTIDQIIEQVINNPKE